MDFLVWHNRRFPIGFFTCIVGVFCAAIACLPAESTEISVQVKIALEFGKELQVKLNGGDAHNYEVSLLSGQFLHVIVEQEGMDITASLFDPQGTRLTRVDSLNGEYGPEPIVAIAATSGTYKVNVASGNKASPPGLYKIKVVELRTPMPGDKEHVAAERQIEAAMRLASDRSAASMDAAQDNLRTALQYYSTSPDSYRHGLLLYTLAFLLGAKGDFQQALNYYQQALTLFQSSGDSMMQAEALNNLAGAYKMLGEPLKAMDFHQQSLSMLPSGRAEKVRSALLNNIGELYSEMGDWSLALQFYEKSLAVSAALEDPRNHANVLHNIGAVYGRLGEPERALDYFEQSLVVRRQLKDPGPEADTQTEIAQVLLSQGQPEKAMDRVSRAIELAHVIGNIAKEANADYVLANIHIALGQPERALEAAGRALEKRSQLHHQVDAAAALLLIGNIYLDLQKPGEAREHLQRASTMLKVLAAPQLQARVTAAMARVERQLGNVQKALDETQEALKNIESVRARIGSPDLRASFLSTRRELYEFYLDLVLHYPTQLAPQGNVALAFEISEKARARSLLETLSSQPTQSTTADELSSRKHKIEDELAFDASRLLRLRQQNATGADELERKIESLEFQYNQAESEQLRRDSSYAALAQPDFLTVDGLQQKLLDDRTLLLEYYLGKEKSFLWAITRKSTLVYELPSQMNIENACRRFYNLVKTHPVKAALPERKEELADAASELSNLVLGPVADSLGDYRLLVVADGALHYVPFAALNQLHLSRGVYQPLAVTHEIVTLPSASAFAAQRAFFAQRTVPNKSLAILADPVFSIHDERLGLKAISSSPSTNSISRESSITRLLEHVTGSHSGEIPRLPFTANEADRIIGLAPKGSSFKAVGFSANRKLATSPELGDYKYLHFATHGYLDTRHPELSAIVLSLVDQSGNPEDGFLRLQDINNLHLRAELVVLSACETGLGKEVGGEGLIGLTRGFIHAGAARVLVSLWDVSDRGTSELMPRFYSGIQQHNQSPATALREAQLSMLKEKKWQDPYYWAAFILEGEWQ